MEVDEHRRGRLFELDALRGVGAISVVLFHLTTRFPEIFPEADHIPFRFWAGEYRVLLFFALSGFAIFFSLDRLKYAPDFLVNRFQRLFPAYWVAIAIIVIAEHFAGIPLLHSRPFDVAINLTMLQAYFYVHAVDGAYWTLAYELGFYACMFAIWWVNGLKRLEAILLGWLLLRMLLYYWIDMPTRVAILTVAQFIPFFAVGMLSYRVWVKQRTVREQIPCALAVLGVVIVSDPVDLWIAVLVLFALFAGAISGWLRILCIRPLLWLGSISYSLYLVHENIGFIVLLKAQAMGLDHWTGLVLALAIVTLLGWALNRWVEVPAAKWIDIKWQKAKANWPLRGQTAPSC